MGRAYELDGEWVRIDLSNHDFDYSLALDRSNITLLRRLFNSQEAFEILVFDPESGEIAKSTWLGDTSGDQQAARLRQQSLQDRSRFSLSLPGSSREVFVRVRWLGNRGPQVPVVLAADRLLPLPFGLSFDDAASVSVNQTYRSGMESGDGLWVRFEARAGHCYVMETSRLRGDVDTVIELRDREEELIAENDDWGGTLASRLVRFADQPSSYWMRIYDFNGSEHPDRGFNFRISESSGTCGG